MIEINKLYNADCMQLLPEIDDKSVDLLLTDIPYGEVSRKDNGLRNLDKGVSDIVNFSIDEFVDLVSRKVKGSMYVFCGIMQVSDLKRAMVRNGLSTRLCIWRKTNPSPMNGENIWLSGIECCMYGKFKDAVFNEHCKNCVWDFPTVRGKLNPTMKPLALMEYLVRTSSNEGQTVLDCCMGSGSTIVAAIRNKRNWIGIEQDEICFDLAKERIEKELSL